MSDRSGRPDVEGPGEATPAAAPLPASIVDPVVADAARRAGVAIDRVTIVSAEAVTFPDRGLGCPLPGMTYPQVRVDGYRVLVEAGGRTFDYRGTGGSFRLCDRGQRSG
ncbi:MAG TPA: hypothetical protein VH440_10825 [Candidatus Limnocylindrales bacterium]|jgi:hypothetical protein